MFVGFMVCLSLIGSLLVCSLCVVCGWLPVGWLLGLCRLWMFFVARVLWFGV